MWREGPRARASLRSLKSHNLGFPSSSFTGEGGHPAGGVARAASPRAGVALQCAPQTPRGLGSGEQRTPKSLCPARRGKVRARAQRRRRLPQMREARAEKTRRAAPSAPPLRPPSPGVGGGGRKSRERGIGATLGPGKHVAENAAGRSPVGAGRRARPAAGAGPRGAARSRPSAPARPAARPSSPPRSLTPERCRRRRRSRVCPAEGEGRRGGGGGLEVPLQRGLLCPCAEMTHGVPSRHARAQRTDTHKERGKYTAPARPPPPASRRGRPGQALRARPPLRPARPPPARGARTRRGPAPQSNNSRPR